MGRRGFGSPIAMERFNPVPTFTEYLQQANDALVTMVQIETKEALEAIDEIAAVDGIDVLFIGPFDLGKPSPMSPLPIRVQTDKKQKPTTSGTPSSTGSSPRRSRMRWPRSWRRPTRPARSAASSPRAASRRSSLLPRASTSSRWRPTTRRSSSRSRSR